MIGLLAYTHLSIFSIGGRDVGSTFYADRQRAPQRAGTLGILARSALVIHWREALVCGAASECLGEGASGIDSPHLPGDGTGDLRR